MRDEPRTGDETTVLLAALQSHRDVMVWKLDGLSDEEQRRPMVPSGTNLLGLVKHLANAEYGWFCETFGRPTEPLTDISQDLEADMRAAPGETTSYMYSKTLRPWVQTKATDPDSNTVKYVFEFMTGSNTVVGTPRCVNSYAAVSPAGPAPMTTTGPTGGSGIEKVLRASVTRIVDTTLVPF